MTSLTLLDKVVEAPQAAGATEEMIAAAEWFLGSLGIPHGVVATGRATTGARCRAPRINLSAPPAWDARLLPRALACCIGRVCR